VRSIIKRFGPEFVANNAQEVPKDARRSGRPLVRTKRWQRSVYRTFWPPQLTGFHRQLASLSQKNPHWGLRTLSSEMDKWERRAAAARPSGAVVRIPKVACPQTISRCEPI
jgi:hypothetical protein